MVKMQSREQGENPLYSNRLFFFPFSLFLLRGLHPRLLSVHKSSNAIWSACLWHFWSDQDLALPLMVWAHVSRGVLGFLYYIRPFQNSHLKQIQTPEPTEAELHLLRLRFSNLSLHQNFLEGSSKSRCCAQPPEFLIQEIRRKAQ